MIRYIQFIYFYSFVRSQILTMCGIICVLGKSNIGEILINGLTVLKNRGYDSCGVCYIENNTLKTIKYATPHSLELLARKLSSTSITSEVGIGHTRWATHGNVTVSNAHPHLDNHNRVSLVHNGIIENAHELKLELEHIGYHFYSQTDTEVISVLIGYFLDNQWSMKEAIELTVRKLTGTWAVVFLHRDFPNKIWVTRNGSPLLLGIEKEYVIVASEHTAFSKYIKQYVVLDNHDIIEITKLDGTIEYTKNIDSYQINDTVHEETHTPVYYGVKHWMLKEIYEQSDSSLRAMNNGGRIQSASDVKLGGLDSHHTELMNLQHLILLGCGTSYHAGLWVSSIFKHFDMFTTVSVHDGGEFELVDIPKNGKVGMILISQSGETKDLHRCIEMARDHDIFLIGVINAIDSMIARETDCGVYLNCGREIAVASTKSFTNQCIVLTMIAVWFAQNHGKHELKRKKIISDIMNLPYQIQRLIEQYEDIARLSQFIDTFRSQNSVFVLGKGNSFAIAREAALKMKEVCYIHAEGYSSSCLKHGPLALLTDGVPVILLDFESEYHDKNWNCFQEIIARGARCLFLTNMNRNTTITQNHHHVLIEKNNTFNGILANVFLQLLSYHISVDKQINPDFPRNLAKVVTVF